MKEENKERIKEKGFGEEKMNRKNAFSFFLMLLVLTSCVGKKEERHMPEHATEQPSSTPEVTATPAPEPVLLGSAITKLLDKSDSRLHNIRLAISKLNGYRISPGEEFSFNRVVGPRTPEQGYKDAAVIVKEEKQTGCGGGVCQVSTTLYQAAKSAGLRITERNNHSGEVGYAQKGYDAAVDYGHLDMRFVNQTQKTVKIYISVDGEGISAQIYHLP